MPIPDLTNPTITVESWIDPVVDALGHPTRSTYVEKFWLSVLGPSTTWLVRLVDSRLEAAGGPVSLDLEATAGALGLGRARGRHSPLVRSLHRAAQFGLAREGLTADVAVRRTIPPLTRVQIDRLPPSLRAEHDRWCAVERDARSLDGPRRRARRIALALAELGEDIPTTEQRLHRYRFHPAIAREAAVWAHRVAAGPRHSSTPRSVADQHVGELPPAAEDIIGVDDEAALPAPAVDLTGDAA